MEMEQREVEAVDNKRCAILDKATLLEKGIKIPNLEQFLWTLTKQNYEKHVERMENWKDILEEKNQAFKASLVPLFMMGWEAPMSNVILEFLNTLLITLVKAEKGQQVDWAQIIFNNLCNELDMWYKYVKDNKGDTKDIYQSTLV